MCDISHRRQCMTCGSTINVAEYRLTDDEGQGRHIFYEIVCDADALPSIPAGPVPPVLPDPPPPCPVAPVAPDEPIRSTRTISGSPSSSSSSITAAVVDVFRMMTITTITTVTRMTMPKMLAMSPPPPPPPPPTASMMREMSAAKRGIYLSFFHEMDSQCPPCLGINRHLPSYFFIHLNTRMTLRLFVKRYHPQPPVE